MTPFDRADILAAALAYIARGMAPVPVPFRQKGPVEDGWQNMRISADTAPRYFNGEPQNIGVILGAASGGLCDVDLDCIEAIRAAPYFLPTTAVFGHASKPASHYVYRSNLCATQERGAQKFVGSDKHGLLEVRMGAGGRAAQTIFPPSTHISGEPIAWEDGGPDRIAAIDGEELLKHARRLAAAAEIARNYPKVGARHGGAHVLGGFLRRCGFSPAEAALFAEAVAAASAQPRDKRSDMKRTARDGAEAGKRAGFPLLAEMFSKEPAKKVAAWLDYQGEEPPPNDAPPIGQPIAEPEVLLANARMLMPEPISWLWPNWLQRRAFNLIAGKSTAGKSTIALSLCATITSGGQWPDGQSIEPFRALYWSGEDGVRDTLLPRFLAAGGDPENMLFIEGVREAGGKRPFDPAVDMKALAAAIEKIGDVALIVLDPIALTVKGDSHKNVETRVGLQPFADLCAQIGACGLGVHHLTKFTDGGDPLERVSGSLAFHALPRCVLLAAKDINAGEGMRRVLLRVKVANGPDWGGFDYQLQQRALDRYPEILAQSVLWGAAIEGAAREILAELEEKPADGKQRKAVLFLAEALKDGPQLAAEVTAKAGAAGIPERTLRYALKDLGVRPERHGRGRDHFVIWELPNAPAH